ncbi:gastrula zinc finger protein xFG20-1-like [Zophobas morio]
MIGDYDDDTHFCLKCHTTIIGLDNYVSHRKAGCSKNVVDIPKSPLPSQLLPPDDSFNLKADDFFSSLELQSSTKKLTNSTSGKNLGILTRSKTTAVIQASTSQKDNQEIPQSKSGKNVWIGGHQLKLGYGDNQSKLIKAVDNLERRKEEPPKITVYEESDIDSEDYEYDVDESSDEDNHDAPPRNHTGGKWKPSSPIQWQRQDWNIPPPSYTGGKWKPSIKRTSPPPSHTKGKWKPSYPLSPKETYDFPPPTFTGSKWSQSKARQDYDVPPSNHTKGKWKPDDEPKDEPLKPKSKLKKDTDILPPSYTSGKWKPSTLDAPAPNYTKGKWIPSVDIKKNSTKITDDSPFRKSSGTVQYWCRPCNRRLASKVVYERHLKSELHFKRTLHDKEFDENVGIVSEKRNKKKTIDESNLIDDDTTTSTKKRKRKKIFLRCEVCSSKVNRNLMGKHLISHYHCRKGDISTNVARMMVLEHIDDIILQSPFQCGLCKFYFNHHKDFLEHWLSEYHESRADSHGGYFWCSLCKFRHTSSAVMYDHLISEEHEVVVSVINRSVPIIVKKITPIKCEECNEEFLLNIALKRHCQIERHTSQNLLTNLNNLTCEKCQQVFRSNISLKRHKQRAHGDNVFICTVCNKNFLNKDEARVHRNTSEHRYRILATKKQDERKCDYCPEIFQNLPDLKDHLRTKHPEFSFKCGHCGSSFTLSQELSVHLRTKSCTYKENYDSAGSCDKCPFSSNSTSELLFHKVLHTEPLVILPDDKDPKKKPIAQYKCPLCDKFFVKASLQPHLRIHTKERPFVCSICNKGFVRKNNWKLHVRNHERKKEKKLEQKQNQEARGSRPFLCSTCGASFAKKKILQQHMITHSGKLCKCPKLGCIFSARSMAELKHHFKTHSDVKSFSCDICDYRGKTKQQLKSHLTVHDQSKKYSCTKCSFSARTLCHLKRHIRLHTGSKPFNCPHCTYKCNTLENLRKHILLTNKHPGKCIYECKFCENSAFQSNFAKEFKVHLVGQHPQIFKTGREATSFIAGIYDVQDDRTEFPAISEDEEEVIAESEKDRSQPKVIILHQSPIQVNKDPVVAASSSKDTPDEIFPMYIVSKDDSVSVDNLTESWNVVGSYDVEESGALVPFNSDNVLFQGHF